MQTQFSNKREESILSVRGGTQTAGNGLDSEGNRAPEGIFSKGWQRDLRRRGGNLSDKISTNQLEHLSSGGGKEKEN